MYMKMFKYSFSYCRSDYISKEKDRPRCVLIMVYCLYCHSTKYLMCVCWLWFLAAPVSAGIVTVSVCTNTVYCSVSVCWLWFYIAWVCGDTVMAHGGANIFYCRTIVCWMVFLQHKCALALSQYKYMPIQSVAGIMSVGWL